MFGQEVSAYCITWGWNDLLLFSVVDEKTTESVPQVDGVNLMKLAQKLHMNTDVRKKILFAIVTSNVRSASSV